MKKAIFRGIIGTLLIAAVINPSVSFSAEAPNVKTGSVSVPVSIGLTGSGNAAKTYLLDLPSGILASSIRSGSLKYSGNNTIIDSISIENGKIKLKLKGNEKKETFSVRGAYNRYDDKFRSVPGNSIWRYADGRRWQINDYDEDRKANFSYNFNATDSLTPSGDPPHRAVTTKSTPVDPSTAVWYKDESSKVEYSSVDPSSVDIVASPSSSGDLSIKNGGFTVTHVIPTQNFTPEEVPDSFEKGPWVIGRLYYTTVYYYFTGTARVTAYSYSGTVSFDYTLPSEPTLDGKVTVVNPSPNPTQFKGVNIPVTLRVNGNLLAYTDSSNIQEWVFYAKETGSSDVKMMKDYNKVLSSTQSFSTFILPKDKVKQAIEARGEFEQEYTLTVTVRFSRPVATASGSISSLTQTMKATVGAANNPDPPPTGGNKRPVAILSVPDSVMAGQEFLVYGADSYDPDGTIVDYNYGTGPAVDEVTGKYGFTWYPLSEVGNTRTISLVVTDNDDLSGSTTGKVDIEAPKPRAAITVLGTKKENRKVTLHNASIDLATHFPMDPAKTRIMIQAVSGGTASDIKYSGSLSGVNDKDVVFKKPGTYRATIYVENNVGYSDTAQITFDIAPDQPPVPYISVPSQAYRDPDNGNKAAAVLDDLSFSPDFDYIGHRFWQYRYDSDNDGSFTDESWTTLSDGNESRVNFTPAKVGRYEIRLTVTEEFDQPTIDEFVTAADRKSANTDTQSAAEKIVTVYNRAPVVDWSW
ncbi:hypothetical protein [Paenibacillus stellifer]|nr:hypothetical protein [Paenibacillus stellifer]